MSTEKKPMPRCTPEQAGVPSAAIDAYLKALTAQKLALHDVLMVRHGQIIFEAYWKPMDETFRHRCYCLKYDVLPYLREGKNEWGAALGPGFFAQETWSFDGGVSFGEVRLCYRLALTDALGNTADEQLRLAKNTAKAIADLVESGRKVVVVHGNGPQVGMINLGLETAANAGAASPWCRS